MKVSVPLCPSEPEENLRISNQRSRGSRKYFRYIRPPEIRSKLAKQLDRLELGVDCLTLTSFPWEIPAELASDGEEESKRYPLLSKAFLQFPDDFADLESFSCH